MNDIAPARWKWVGTRPIRPDGVPKVTGRAMYGADMAMPGMLWGKVIRSPHAHARIRSIDPSRALALPGVKAVVTAADFPDQKFAYVGPGWKRQLPPDVKRIDAPTRWILIQPRVPLPNQSGPARHDGRFRYNETRRFKPCRISGAPQLHRGQTISS